MPAGSLPVRKVLVDGLERGALDGVAAIDEDARGVSRGAASRISVAILASPRWAGFAV